jgi:protein involved in polysaccharide export with SLBB domain
MKLFGIPMDRRAFLLAAAGAAFASTAVAQTSGDTSAAPTPAPQNIVDDDYVLGSGDKIRLIVYGEESLSGEFFVAGSGDVSLPLVGQVRAANLTISAFRESVRTALMGGYLRDPKVSVEVTTYRPFYILGEIARPGEYPYTTGLNVQNAIATAGGYTYRAQQKYVFIRGSRDNAERRVDITPQLRVAPGDTIRIVERFF